MHRPLLSLMGGQSEKRSPMDGMVCALYNYQRPCQSLENNTPAEEVLS